MLSPPLPSTTHTELAVAAVVEEDHACGGAPGRTGGSPRTDIGDQHAVAGRVGGQLSGMLTLLARWGVVGGEHEDAGHREVTEPVRDRAAHPVAMTTLCSGRLTGAPAPPRRDGVARQLDDDAVPPAQSARTVEEGEPLDAIARDAPAVTGRVGDRLNGPQKRRCPRRARRWRSGRRGPGRAERGCPRRSRGHRR